jgi:hypothetical protein
MPRTDDDIPLVAGVPLRLQIKKPRPTTKIARFYSTVNTRTRSLAFRSMIGFFIPGLPVREIAVDDILHRVAQCRACSEQRL